MYPIVIHIASFRLRVPLASVMIGPLVVQKRPQQKQTQTFLEAMCLVKARMSFKSKMIVLRHKTLYSWRKNGFASVLI